MAKAMEEDATFAAGVLKRCFGRGGDFTVVVDEREGGGFGVLGLGLGVLGFRGLGFGV